MGGMRLPGPLVCLCASLGALLLGRPALALDAAAPPGWTESARGENLAVFYREEPKTHAQEILAYTEFDAPPEAVFRVVTDFEAWPKFMPFSKESKILQRAGDDSVLLYQLVSPPMVSDRDYVLEVALTFGSPANGFVYKSQWSCVPDGLPERKGVIRMRINDGSWTYAPIDGGKRTRVTYSLLSSPGGAIPDWMVNRSSRALVPDIFQAVRERVARQGKAP